MKGLEYGDESSAFVSVFVSDVDEVPEFSLDILAVAVLENITEGSALLTVEAKDPEGKEIRSAAQNKPIKYPHRLCVLVAFPALRPIIVPQRFFFRSLSFCFLECFLLLCTFKICVEFTVNWSKQMSFLCAFARFSPLLIDGQTTSAL